MRRSMVCLLVVFLCSIVIVQPVFSTIEERAMPLEQFSAAPDVKRPIPTPEQIQQAVEKFKQQILKAPADSEYTLLQYTSDFGRHLGLVTDLMTLEGAKESKGYFGGLHKGLGRLGTSITVITITDKWWSGERIDMDILWEGAKFLGEKALGGPVVAMLNIMKYGLDTVGMAALAQIDSDFYSAYVNYHLQEHSAEYFWKMYNEPNWQVKIAATLDKFWDDPVAHGIRGWHSLVVQYDKRPEDKGLYKQAYREKFMHEFVYPSLRTAEAIRYLSLCVK